MLKIDLSLIIVPVDHFKVSTLATPDRVARASKGAELPTIMALRQVMRTGSGLASSVARRTARGGGGPPMPIFARNKPIDFTVSINSAHVICYE